MCRNLLRPHRHHPFDKNFTLQSTRRQQAPKGGDAHQVSIVDYHRGGQMLPQKRIPTHPGEVLSEEFLKPLGLTQVALAEHLGVPVQRINELVRGKRGVTPGTALAPGWRLRDDS
jgi:hypothetical protein